MADKMTDYISREEAIEAVNSILVNCNPDDFNLEDKESYGWWMHSNGENLSVIKAELEIEKVPAADVKPVICGYWEGNAYPVCSECRRPALSEKTNLRVVDNCYEFDGSVKLYKDVRYDTVYRKTDFCPHCGARMDLVRK